MITLQKEEFNRRYQAGKSAFASGQYRLSIENFQQAIELIPEHSRLGGEARMWLVNAYQAAGRQEEAASLCQELTSHPHGEIRRQSQKLLYIIKAPQLKRPPEWMSEIPDLNSVEGSSIKYRSASGESKIKAERQIEIVDLTQVNDSDNQFIGMGLILIVGILLLFLFS